MKKIFLCLTLLLSLTSFAQTDTIISKSGKTIIGTITLVNDNNIFYNTKKSDGEYIGLSEVSYYSKSGKGKTSIVPNAIVATKTQGVDFHLQEDTKVQKKGKGLIVASGVCLIAAGTISLINTNATPPSDIEDIKNFNKMAKNRTMAQGAFIVLAGAFLAVGVSFTF